MFLRVAEWSVIALIIICLMSQVVVPMWRNRPIFPILRSRRKLESELRRVNESRDEVTLKTEIKAVRKSRGKQH